MSFSSNNIFYDDLSFESYPNNNSLIPSNVNCDSSYEVFGASFTVPGEHFNCSGVRETECVAKKDAFYYLPHPVKIEQCPDFDADNSHFDFPIINNEHSALVYTLLAKNCDTFQQLSPQLSYTDHSALDICYGDGSHSSFDYYMSASPTASYSLSPPPTLSPELQCMGLSYNDTADVDNNYNYQYAVLQYPPIVKAETPVCCDSTKDFSLDSTSIHIPSDNMNSINIGYVNDEDDHKSSNSTIHSDTATVCSSNDDTMTPKKIYPCNYCKRSFARKYDVARHKRIHTGSKPYVCPHCLKGFSRSDARVRHFRTELACRDGAEKLGRHKTQKQNPANISKH